jgi:formylglycine-generating enzyme required for sulfatase activity
MSGNVAEWVQDGFEENSLALSYANPVHPTDGRAYIPSISQYRLVRGGSLYAAGDAPVYLTTTYNRGYTFETGLESIEIGFRCVTANHPEEP